MWKPKVTKDGGYWHVAGRPARYRKWRDAYAEARRAAARFAGREVPC